MPRPRLRPTRTVIIAGPVTLLGAGTAVAAAAVMSGSRVLGTGVTDGCWTQR